MVDKYLYDSVFDVLYVTYWC